jgi:uncharacterized protein YpmS
LWLLLPVLAATVLGVGYVLIALRREPEFYRVTRAALQNETVRATAAAEFTAQTEELATAVETRADWTVEFTEQQINAWLMQEYSRRANERSRSLVRNPLVDLEPGRFRIGAQVDAEQFSGLVSLDVAPHLEADETLVLDVNSIRVGDLPIPASRLIAEVSRHIDQSDWRVTIETEPSLRVVIPLRELGRSARKLKLTKVDLQVDRITLGGEAPEGER